MIHSPLFQRLRDARRVVQISAPAGSGKTVLLRSWICSASLADSAAWVQVEQRQEHDPQQFWTSVVNSLRSTTSGSRVVRPIGAAPEVDGWAAAERLLDDLVQLRDRLWLVLDDMHELHSDEAQSQLEMLVMRAPRALRFVFATRRDLRPRLGLDQLQLNGELTDIRAADLRFTLEEARTLLDSAGMRPQDLAPASRRAGGAASPPAPPSFPGEPLTDGEIRVLRYLPTHLTAPEIACQLYLSVHTVSTHMRHIYTKLGVHRRHEAVDRARAHGLLEPIFHRVYPYLVCRDA